MERIISDMETRRRAEEIYSRRNGNYAEHSERKYYSIYKVFFQFLVLINIAISFVVYSNKDFIFSSDFLNQVNEFYTINILNKIDDFFGIDENNEIEENDKKIVEENNNTVLDNNQISEIDIIKF